MATPGHVMRLDPGLTQAALAKGAGLGLTNLTAVTRTALLEWTGTDTQAQRTAALEAENAQLREQLSVARKALGSVKQARGDDGDRLTRLAAAIQAAIQEFPATPAGLAVASGFTLSYVNTLLKNLRDAGAVTHPADGEYLPAPGADIRKALQEARAANSQAVTDRAARRKSGAAVPVKAKSAPRERKEAAPAESPPPVAADEAKAATVEALREKAEQIAPGTVMFQEPGAGRRVTHPVPDPVDHTRKQARKPKPEGASEIAAAIRNRRNGGQR